MSPKFFPSANEFHRWLDRHHDQASELVVGFYKKDSGKGGMTYPEALDEALCFGWIDGVRKAAGTDRYTIRFTPRKPRSTWSLVNLRHFDRLTKLGRMHPAGLKAFQAREPKKSGMYSFEQRPESFPAAPEKIFRAKKKAWTFWQQQPPGYRRTIIWWVISAKQDATRKRRLAALIRDSARGQRLNLLAPLRGHR